MLGLDLLSRSEEVGPARCSAAGPPCRSPYRVVVQGLVRTVEQEGVTAPVALRLRGRHARATVQRLVAVADQVEHPRRPDGAVRGGLGRASARRLLKNPRRSIAFSAGTGMSGRSTTWPASRFQKNSRKRHSGRWNACRAAGFGLRTRSSHVATIRKRSRCRSASGHAVLEEQAGEARVGRSLLHQLDDLEACGLRKASRPKMGLDQAAC